MNDFSNLRTFAQPICDFTGTSGMLPHSQCQCFQTLEYKKCIEWTDCRSQIAQQGHPRFEDVSDRTKRLGGLCPNGTVITGVGRIEARVAVGICLPIEITAIDDRPGYRSPMS